MYDPFSWAAQHGLIDSVCLWVLQPSLSPFQLSNAIWTVIIHVLDTIWMQAPPKLWNEYRCSCWWILFFIIFIKCIRAETAAECELHRKKKYHLQSKCRGISVCSCCSITWNPDHFASALVKLLSSSLPSAWPEPASGGAGPFRRHHPQADRSDPGGGPERHPVPVTGSACAGEN